MVNKEIFIDYNFTDSEVNEILELSEIEQDEIINGEKIRIFFNKDFINWRKQEDEYFEILEECQKLGLSCIDYYV